MKNIMSDELLNKIMEVINSSPIISPKESNKLIFVIGAGLGALSR